MMLYVLAVWLCAIVCVVLVELFALALLPQFVQSTSQSSVSHLATEHSASTSLLSIEVSCFLLCLILAYICEWRLKPIYSWYKKLQKDYPAWYQKWPADRRELYLAAFVSVVILLCSLFVMALMSFTAPAWVSLFAALGLSLGFSLPPVLRYRKLWDEDRPEQPPQAVLHRVVPKYSIDQALRIGQIYLRLLLPVFALFCMLILPFALELIQIQALQGILLLSCLIAGAALGWYSHPESHLNFASFRNNLYQLCSLSLMAAALLFFGVASGNIFELVLMSTFSGYLVGIY